MPALSNPRHEAFAQAFVASLASDRKGKNTATAAYLAAGYKANKESARRCASRLLTFVDTISARVAELQHEAQARLQPKLDVSLERIGRRLDLASRLAEQAESPQTSAIVAAELGIAKVFGHITDKHEDVTKPNFEHAESLNDVGIKLLQSVGYAAPSASDVALALDAHAALIEQLEAIAERAQALTPSN